MKIAYIDFEYIPQKNFVIPVCACIGVYDNSVFRYRKSWLHHDDKAKQNLAQVLNTLHEKGYTFCAFYLPAEASGMRAIGLEPLNFHWSDAQIVGMPFLHSSLSFKKHFKIQDTSQKMKHSSLLDFYNFFCGIESPKEDKEASRNLILSLEHRAATMLEQQEILAYCQSDVTILKEIFYAQLKSWVKLSQRNDFELLERFKNWSRFCLQMDDISHHGVPLNHNLYNHYIQNYSQIVDDEKKKCPEFYLYEKNKYTLKQELIGKFIESHDLQNGWEKTKDGKYKFDKETLSHHQHIKEIAQFSISQRIIHQAKFFKEDAKTKEPKIAKYVTEENGVLLQHPKFNPFGTETSRNAHTATSFIMAMDKSIRKDFFGCPEDMTFIFPDYSAQEVWVAGALSGDKNLLKASHCDPFIEFGKSINFVPDSATKETHPEEREICKKVILANFYGRGVNSLHLVLQRPKKEIEVLHAKLHQYCKTFFTWQNKTLNEHERNKYLETVDGWAVFENTDNFGEYDRPKMMNFPVQAHGAVLLRKAVDLFYANRHMLPAKNIRIIYTLHDEIGVLCPIIHKSETELFMTRVMQDACRYYFPNYEPLRIGFK